MKSDNATALEILVVDDDKVVALLHKNQLRCSNVEPAPLIFSNGKEALHYLSRNDSPEKNFLVLLDLNMPVVDGWKFLKKLKNEPPQGKVFVVIVTSSINQKDYLRTQSYASVIHYCLKPLSAACVTKIKNLPQLKPFFIDEEKEEESCE